MSHEERYRAVCDWPASVIPSSSGASAGAPTGSTFNGYSLMVRAAIAGQRVALGWHHIVGQLGEEARLMRVGSEEVTTERPFELPARPPALRKPAVIALRNWLIAAAAH